MNADKMYFTVVISYKYDIKQMISIAMIGPLYMPGRVLVKVQL